MDRNFMLQSLRLRIDEPQKKIPQRVIDNDELCRAFGRQLPVCISPVSRTIILAVRFWNLTQTRRNGLAGDEIKIIHKDRTFNDQALYDLAHSQAACMCRLQFGSCTKENCRNCETKMQLKHCKSELCDYDLLRLKTMTGDEYANLSRIPENWMKPEDIDKSLHKFFWDVFGKPLVIALALLSVFFLLCIIPKPQDTPRIDWDTAITNTVRKTQANLRDVDQNGIVNCVDAAIIFKWIWDEDYPLLKDTCTIIRNYNPGKMNHLFIAIQDTTKPLVYVEPRAYYPQQYTMSYNWGDIYDSRFNWYGETQKWLNKAK